MEKGTEEITKEELTEWLGQVRAEISVSEQEEWLIEIFEELVEDSDSLVLETGHYEAVFASIENTPVIVMLIFDEGFWLRVYKKLEQGLVGIGSPLSYLQQQKILQIDCRKGRRKQLSLHKNIPLDLNLPDDFLIVTQFLPKFLQKLGEGKKVVA